VAYKIYQLKLNQDVQCFFYLFLPLIHVSKIYVIKFRQLFDQAALQLENVLCKYVHFFIKVVDCYNINKLLYIKLYFVIVFFVNMFLRIWVLIMDINIFIGLCNQTNNLYQGGLLRTTQPKTRNRKASSASTCISILVDNSLRCLFTTLNTILC